MSQQQPISLLLCALGGEGGGVLTEWLVETARHAGYPVQATSIPGVAQRTGATTYYLEVFPVPLAELGGKRPVLGLYPVPGRLDALVSSELLETARQIGLGHASADRTLVLSSSARTLTTMEKMQMGDGRRDAQGLLNLITAHSRAHGGEGGGVLTEWLVETARHAGYPVQATSIPGVAQRTGATTYYLEVFPVPLAELGGKRPVLGLYPVPGRLDALVSSELLETARQIGLGHASSDRTLVLSSSARTLTTMEKMHMGDGRRDTHALIQLVAAHSRAHHVLDMAELTRQAGTIVSAVMLGCIAASGLLPMARADYEALLGESGNSAKASLRGFALGFDAVQAQRTQARFVEQVLAPQVAPATTAAAVPALPAAVAALFPAVLHELIALAHARLVAYQNAAYAQRYVERLQQVLAAERSSDPQGTRGWAVTREMARWLALWMAFDDIVHVADLKSRASRWHRVQGEVKAGQTDLLKLYDHFKPGAPEFAALLPQGLAQRVLAWDRRRVLAGKQPWALPLKIGTHSVLGMLALRTLAGFKWLRPLGSRFANEQALIEQWLAAVVAATQRHWPTGFEIAQCGRLIKGYGSTNERGKDNLLHVVEHLASAGRFATDEARAAAIAAARSAALADDAGKTLDQTLVQHGVPARPVKPQPIRWVRNPRLKKTS